MIKYNNSNINDWNYDAANIVKVYHNNAIVFYKVSVDSPTPSSPKWLATYTGGTTSSAECDSTSAITSGEITKTDLESVVIGDCVTSIGDYAFQNYTSLTSITIPDSVTSIGNRAFYNCTSLTSATLGSGVTSISEYAFYLCTSLMSIAIPNSVTSIGDRTFFKCFGLSSVTIPNSVTSIGNYVFQYCRSLTSIDIPNGVTSIGANAFSNCTSLTSVTIYAETPPTLVSGNAFVYTDCPIYVPSESVEAYKAASGWSDYSSRIQAIP